MLEDISNQPIYLSRPNIIEKDIQAVVEVLRSGNLVQGVKVNEFEQKIAKSVGSEYVTAVSNGTASLHLSLLAQNIGPGDEVIIPAFSYIATANAVELTGAKPIFVDIQLDTFNINVSQIEEAITNKTKCIMPVHEFGLCADMDGILALATSYGLSVIEDAACAIGARYKGQHSGTFGDFGSYSLHPRKSVTSGEGGIIISKTAYQDQLVKTLRNHGIQYNSNPMDFVLPGFNYRMTDFQAALVSSQYDRLDQILEKKVELASLYLELLDHPSITLPVVPPNCTHTWQTFHILCGSHSHRDKLMAYLKKHNVFCNYGAQCIPAMTFYKGKYNLDVQNKYVNSYRAYTDGLALPLGELLTEIEVRCISKLINDFKE